MFRLRCSLTACLCCLTAVVLCVAAQAAAPPDAETTEIAIRMLGRAVNPQRDGSHLPLLFALRQLRDPDLKSFFYQLAQRPDWQMQVHAVLGLGEIDPHQHIDPWLVTQIAPLAQEQVVATGLDLDLISRDQIPEILKWEKLHPMARMFLLSELVLLKEPVDQNDLLELTKSEDDHIAGLCACLLAQLGNAVPLNAFGSRLTGLAQNPRQDVQVWLMEAIRRYHLTACQAWMTTLLDDPNIDSDVAYRGIYTLLDLDPAAGIDRWTRFLGQSPSYSQRVRFGLVLLATGQSVPASAYERLVVDSSEELITKMVALGRAISDKADPSDALIELLDLGHAKTTTWAMDFVAKLPPEQSTKVYKHMIDRLAGATTEKNDSVALAVQSTSKLFDIDPQAVLDRLRQVEDDSLQQQAILLGLFETTSPTVGEAAGSLRRIGSGRADSLAFLLMAKHSKTLSAADTQQLGQIAAGAGRVSDILQIQAAWMYLKHTAQIEAALATVFMPAPTTKPTTAPSTK